MLSAMPVMAHACGEVCSRNEPGLNWVPESVKRMYSANVMASTDWGSAPRWWGSTYEQVRHKAIRVRVGHPSNGRGREQFAQRFDQPIATLCLDRALDWTAHGIEVRVYDCNGDNKTTELQRPNEIYLLSAVPARWRGVVGERGRSRRRVRQLLLEARTRRRFLGFEEILKVEVGGRIMLE